MIGNQKNKEKYIGVGAKISSDMAEVMNTICDILQVDTYHLIQLFVYTIIRAASPHHRLSSEIQKLMMLIESDSGWQEAFNICNPDGLKVAQVILILEQEGKKGFGAVMVDKPFATAAKQTENTDEIVGRVIEVAMPGIFKALRRLMPDCDCKHISDLLLTMIEDVKDMRQDQSDMEEMRGPNNFSEFGREYGYGKKTKAKQHRTVDTFLQQKIIFEPDDQPPLTEIDGDDIVRGLGTKPFDVEP